MTLLPFTFRLLKTEWLFKQSGDYGGPSHIAVNVDEWKEYLSTDGAEVFRILTMCDKRLKYNNTWSTMKARSGSIRNICRNCVINYESEEKAEEAKDRIKQRKAREAADKLPF